MKIKRGLWPFVAAAAAVCGTCGLSQSARAADATPGPQSHRTPGWYQWRGPEQSGASREKNLPDAWAPPSDDKPAGENLLWTAPLGGMSSPVVFNGKLYTYTRDAEVPAGDPNSPTLAPGPDTQEAFVCVDANTGKVIWKHTDPMFQTDVPFHRLGWSNPVGDPVTGRVYGLGAQCNLVCLEGDSGKVVWQRQMTEEFGLISTFGGRTPSPAIDEDSIIVGGVSFGWGDNARGQYRVYCLDKATGVLRWTAGTGGLPVDAPYNTPVIAVINGQRLVITAAGDGGIHAFQARTGRKVWSFKASLRGMNDSVIVDGDYVYAGHDLDNPDTTELGRVYCLDAAHLVPGKPGMFGAGPPPQSPTEVWRFTGKPIGSGVSVGFASPTIAGDRLYFEDDAATVWALDKKTGKAAWSKKCGTTGKASLVWADGKLYVGEANGRYWVLKDQGAKAQVVAKAEVPDKYGREYAIFGSVAINDGCIYLETANKLYCIGAKDHKADADPIPQMAAEEPAPKGEAATLVQVVPADARLRPGQKQQFVARLFDAKGRFLSDADASQVKWGIGQLTLPPAPPLPKVIPPPSSLQPASAAPAPTPAAPTTLPAAMAPTTAPTKVGNLKGDLDASGTLTAVVGPPQAGAVTATVGELTGEARVRVLAPLPLKIDFEASPIGAPPLTWIGAGGKFAVVVDPENPNNKVLQKLLNLDLYYRARTYAGGPDLADYTMKADVMVHDKITSANLHIIPDVGIINSHYVLVLLGNDQKLQMIAWPAAVPDERQPSGSINRTIPYAWKAKTWYHLKLRVSPHASTTAGAGRIDVAGKVWPANEPEPDAWQVEMQDRMPNISGSPGLFGNSMVGEQKSEIYYDNILVTPNTPGTAAANK